MANTSNLGSGDGSRPTTDGGVDNIGGAGTFIPGKGGADAPAPREKASETKKDNESAKRDGSAPFGLRQSPDSTPNTETP